MIYWLTELLSLVQLSDPVSEHLCLCILLYDAACAAVIPNQCLKYVAGSDE